MGTKMHLKGMVFTKVNIQELKNNYGEICN
jgi:hypothetical protein